MTDPIVASALQAGFSDQFAESDVQLDVHGVIPPWVSGALVRNGPAQWTLPETGRFNHWFDGLAMLHRFSIRDGAVHYRNRWLDSRNRTSANRTGRNDYAQFDTDPKRSLWQKLTATLDFPLQFGNNDFITVARFGSDWVAVGETPTQIGIDIDDLSTKGPFEFKDRMFSIWTCSHMVPDPNRDRVYSFSTMGVPVFGRYHLWYVDGNTRRRTRFATVNDRHPSWMHSFGVSERYAVLTAFPLRCNTWQLFVNAFLGRPFIRTFTWHGEQPTTSYLIDRETGRVVRRFDLPAMFAFHFANTYEEDGQLVFDLAAYDDAAAIDRCRLDTLLGPDGGQFPPSQLRRFRVPLDGGPVIGPDVISDGVIEMPRFNDRRSMQPYRYVYGYSFDAPGRFYDRLIKIDTHNPDRDANYVHWAPPGTFPSEPVFVPRPGATAEDDGVVVTVVLDVNGAEPASYLVVLDAVSFTEIARARAPHRIPFGLHGAFAPSATTPGAAT